MANALLDKYKLLKEDVPNYGDNSLLTIRENKLVEPSYGSIVSPPADNTVAQLATANAAAPAESTPTKYFPDTVQALPGSATAPSTPVASTTPAATTPYTPQTEYEKYWKTPVGTSKYNMPLDQFVRIAGLAAKYFDPQNPVANDLIRMGGEAYKERARREYEGPNVLLQRQLAQEHLRKLQEEAPKAWDIFYKEQTKLGKKPEDIVKEWNKITRESQAINYHYTEDEKGNVSTFVNGQLVSGPGKGKDISKQVAYHTVDDAGVVHAFDKTGKEIGRAPGGKTKESPGAAARATEDLRQEREKREWKTIAVTTKDGKQKLLQENKLGQTRYADVPEGADISRIPSTVPSEARKLVDVKLAPKVKAAKEKAEKEKVTKSSQYPEGTIIKSASGERKIMRNGQWIDYTRGEY